MRDVIIFCEFIWLVLQLPNDEKIWCDNRLKRARASVSSLFSRVPENHNLSTPIVLGDQRVSIDPPRWFGRRKTDWSRRTGIFSFNGLVSLAMAVPVMFYRAENFETLTVVFRLLFTALIVFGIGAIVARRNGLDRATAQVCLGTLTGGWLWLMTLTKIFDPSRLNDWMAWAVVFGLAFGIALMLVSGLTLLVCVVMAYLPGPQDREMA